MCPSALGFASSRTPATYGQNQYRGNSHFFIALNFERYLGMKKIRCAGGRFQDDDDVLIALAFAIVLLVFGWAVQLRLGSATT